MNHRISPTSRPDQREAEREVPSASGSPPEVAARAERERRHREPITWATFLLAGIFLLLGAMFILAPSVAARFYGLETHASSALFYVRAIGLRDAALALYLFGLAWARLLRALTIVSLGTLIIPLGDLLLLGASGRGEPVHYLLHAASLLCFAGLAWWSVRAARGQ